MRKLLLSTTLCLIAALLFASAALAQTRGPSGADGTYNCEDFDDQGQAQEFFNGDPGDTNGLDSDDDGVACEALPTIVDDGTDDGSAVPGDPESATPTATSTAEANEDDSASATATAGVGGSASALPDTGGASFALTFVPVALLLAGGLVALRIVRR